MVLSSNSGNPEGDLPFNKKCNFPASESVETYDGKILIDWDPEAAVTPLGQLPFFIQFLKLGGRFDSWVSDCPLNYLSNNAPQKIDVLGSLFLSILSGHKRYAHLTSPHLTSPHHTNE